jgi:hypothetical protein
MKKKGLIFCTVVSLFVLVGSSVWEGVAGVAAGAEFPATGLYIATNSFPLNTIVDITNLENGITTRVVTSMHLESTAGLMAVLSTDAANAIGLASNSLGRIRMVQSADAAAFYRFGQDHLGDEWQFPAPPVVEPPVVQPPLVQPPVIVQPPVVVEPAPAPPVLVHPPVKPLPPPVIVQPVQPPVQAPPVAKPAPAPPVLVHPPVQPPPVPIEPSEMLVFVPAELRPPAAPDLSPDPAYFIPGITPAPFIPPAHREYLVDPSLIIDPIREAPPLPALVLPPPMPAPAPALPIIDRLQVGKYYLQIAAYTNPDAVLSELSRLNALDSALAREAVVFKGINPTYGVIYQILIGPLTHGESGALLHRFRGTHRDAFIRSGG